MDEYLHHFSFVEHQLREFTDKEPLIIRRILVEGNAAGVFTVDDTEITASFFTAVRVTRSGEMVKSIRHRIINL